MPPFRFAPVESPLAAAAQGATQGFERGQGLALHQQRGAREEARFDQEQSKARMDTLANVMRSADTPEKHAQAIQLLQGQGFDFDPEELDFNNREAIVNQALSIRDQLAGERADRAFEATQAQRGVQNELARAGLSERQSQNAFNRGIAQQRVDIARTAATTKAAGAGQTADIKNFELARSQGFEGTFFDFKKQLAEAKGAGKPLTEAQAKSAGFAERMLASNQILVQPEVTQALTDRAQQATGEIPIFGSSLQSEDAQRAQQAKEDFVTAVLRRESGAVISDSEFTREARKFFPQPGDKPATIKQKAAARKRAISGILRAAGPAAEGLTTPGGDEGDIIDAADFFK